MIKNYILLIFLFLSVNIFGQNFDKNWNKVIQYEESGSIKSALKEVNKINKKAKRKHNELEIIKSFFFRSKYIQNLEEDAQNLIINSIQSDILEITEPNKMVLEYIYVASLNKYLIENKYNIQSRTATENTFNPDFQSWSLSDFEKEIDKYVKKALSNKQSLKNKALKDYESILDFQKLENLKDRDLYDFLVEKYIEVYALHLIPWNISEPLFEKNKSSIMGNTSKFLSVEFDSLNDSNLKKASLLYQELERNYPNDKNYQLERLQFFEKYVYKNPATFLEVLNDFQSALKTTELKQEVQLLRANLYAQLASKDEYPEYNKIALQILDSILMVNSRSNNFKTAYIRKEYLLAKDINIRLQEFVYEGENTRAFITFKNTDSLYIKAYRVTNDFPAKYNSFQKDSVIVSIIKNTNPENLTSYKLPNKKDFFSYSTEVLMPLYPKGKYLILFEDEKSGFNKLEKFNRGQ